MQHKNKNIIFIIIVFILLLAIPIFNYIMDPFNTKYIRNHIIVWNMFSRNSLYTHLKINKKVKYDYVIAGGSNMAMFIPQLNRNILHHQQTLDKNIAIICIQGLSFMSMKEIILNFIDLHPETKNVIIPLDYNCLKTYLVDFDTEYNNGILSLKEYCLLFFSKQAIQKSINNLITKKEMNPNQNFGFYPKRNYFDSNKDHFENNKKALHYLINELKRKNINIICFTFPYNALYLQNYPYPDEIDNLKRNVVNQVGFMYDMAFINEYTKIPLDDKNYLYTDIIHPNEFFTSIFYNYIFNNTKRNDIIIKLTQDNIEAVLKHEKELLEDYKKENQNYIQIFNSYDNNPKSKDFEYEKQNSYQNMPEEIRKQIEELYSEKK